MKTNRRTLHRRLIVSSTWYEEEPICMGYSNYTIVRWMDEWSKLQYKANKILNVT